MEEECRRKRQKLQRKASDCNWNHRIPPIVYEVLRSPGQPLDKETREFFEPRFGRDFSRVRVHTDSKAEESARAVNALAYTVGRDVVFGTERYAPEQAEGVRLLSHELTHVVQQGGDHGAIRHSRFSSSSSSSETEACRTAACTERARANVATSKLTLQRQPGAHLSNSERTCGWTSIEDATNDIRIALEILVVLVDQSNWLRKLFITLKKARQCFPAFTEAEFVTLSTEKVILGDDLRKQIASGHGPAVKKDDRKLIWAESKKPFAGYAVSGFDPSKRFTTPKQLRQTGARPTPGHRTATEFADATAQTAKESFESADVLVFSGHQYAQYKAPGVWADSRNTGWDIRRLPGPLGGVKLIVSTSCATLCREAYSVWKPLFPHASVLGYKKSAPLAGGIVANSFAASLPKDLVLDSGGVSSAVSTWKSVVSARHRGEGSTQPGWLDVGSGTMEYWNGRKWVSLNASDESNRCYVKGDYSDLWPEQHTATP